MSTPGTAAGSFDSIDEFLSSPEGDAVFLAKLDFLAEAFRSEPAIMAWELWNEVNCTGPFELWSRWSERMLPELKRRFPNHLALQSLGSYDSIGRQPHLPLAGGARRQ